MISLDFSGGAQSPADFTPDYSIPTGFNPGLVTSDGKFLANVDDANNGWISDTLSGADIYAEIVWDITAASNSRGPMFVNASGNGYLLLVRGSDIRLFLLNGGSLSQIGIGVDNTAVDGDRIKLEYKGSGEFVFYINDVQVGTETDTTVATGLAPGFVARTTTGPIPSFEADSTIQTPSIRKSGTATFDKPAGIGTITGVTLNGNTIDLDSQTVDDFTVTDSDGSITTSGEYDLVATGDTVETISVQVNVVGLPSNTARKDGALLTSMTDLTLDAVNDSGTLVKQLTGITTDASGVISPIDLSDLSEAVGDTLKVSLHSAGSDVGVTFEQALELI